MKDDFDNFDEELDSEEFAEDTNNQYEAEFLEDIINNSNVSEQENVQNKFDTVKEIAKSSDITNEAASRTNAYNKFTQTNLGKNLMTKGSSPLGGLQNNSLNKLSSNRMFNPMNNMASSFNSMSGSNTLPNNNELPEGNTPNVNPVQNNNPLPNPGSSLNNPLANKLLPKGDGSSGISNILNAKQGEKLAGFMKSGKKGGVGLGGKKFLLLKLKIIGIFLAILGIVYIFLFIWFIIDGDEQDFLELTNWNMDTNPKQNENVSSDTNFSNNDKEVLSVSLSDKIGEDGINELITKINNAGNNKCDGANVAKKLVALIDEVGKKGYKIPYSNYSNGYKVIDPDWGKNVDGNIIGLNEFGLIDWAINSANINNTFTNINEFNNRSDMIDLEYGNPGDLIINVDKAYIILQNTGDNVTVAFIDNNGASYKKYTYNDLTSYSIVDMSSYYSANCKN